MKVGIIGMGRVGSSIAAFLMFHPKVNEIYINDINVPKCQAEYEDLMKSAAILNYKVKIKVILDSSFYEFQECDYLFICAGYPRLNSKESMKKLYEKNLGIIDDIVSRLPPAFANPEFGKRVYIATNPWEMFALIFKVKAHSGPWILDRKGYTNWGIAAEAYKVIE
jgi:malate/lactate dehydrogenase